MNVRTMFALGAMTTVAGFACLGVAGCGGAAQASSGTPVGATNAGISAPGAPTSASGVTAGAATDGAPGLTSLAATTSSSSGTPTLTSPPTPPSTSAPLLSQPPALNGAPFTASGTFRGAAFTLSCSTFGNRFNDKDVAAQGTEGQILLACHDDAKSVLINVTIGEPTPGDYIPKHSSEGAGRIAITGGPDSEFVSTSTASNQGKITIATWDAGTRRITGSFSMTWPRDSSGQGGSLQGQFDIPKLPNAQ